METLKDAGERLLLWLIAILLAALFGWMFTDWLGLFEPGLSEWEQFLLAIGIYLLIGLEEVKSK